VVLRDVTERRQMIETIRALSLTDELTGLLNRRGFTSLAGQQLRTAVRTRMHLRAQATWTTGSPILIRRSLWPRLRSALRADGSFGRRRLPAGTSGPRRQSLDETKLDPAEVASQLAADR
jgi:GGDEF domain-containing protein